MRIAAQTVLLLLVVVANTGLQAQSDHKAFLTEAAKRVEEYSEVFHDLTAEETAKIQIADIRGNVGTTRTVVSSLIIYRSQADASLAVEYRDVESVDGKEVKDH